MQISVQSYKDGKDKSVAIDHLPDLCPICHYSITPSGINFAFCDEEKYDRDGCLQVVFRCPRRQCKNLFISYYRARHSACLEFHLEKSAPTTKVGKQFDKIIKDISGYFCTINNQAFLAEQDKLLEICGVGYRKSLEFLIKDYLIKLRPEKESEIKSKLLGKCISEDIKNENIKGVAKRATWLGNDETHYLRKWEGKDLQDLKRLIDLTVHWIEMEQLTKDAINGMPET